MNYRTEQLLYRELRGRQARTNAVKCFVAITVVTFFLAEVFGLVVKGLGL